MGEGVVAPTMNERADTGKLRRDLCGSSCRHVSFTGFGIRLRVRVRANWWVPLLPRVTVSSGIAVAVVVTPCAADCTALSIWPAPIVPPPFDENLGMERSPPLIPAAAISVCLNTRTEANLNNRAKKRPRLAPEVQNDSEWVVPSASVPSLSTWS
jgi:hypothetical protein